MLRIANAAGFPTDRCDAPRRVLERIEIDYLTLHYLSASTLARLALERDIDSSQGHVVEFLDVVRDLAAAIYLQPQWKMITNAGGMNPRACAESIAPILVEQGSPNLVLGAVRGDDLLGRLEELMASGCAFENRSTGEPLDQLKRPIVAANAFLGGKPVADALDAGARIVIAGMMGGTSLATGAGIHAFHASLPNWNLLASAAVAGYILQHGTHVTRGDASTWPDIEFTNIGYPMAELAVRGPIRIIKPPGTGGILSPQSIAECLIHPDKELAPNRSPDVAIRWDTLRVLGSGPDIVEIDNARGQAPGSDYGAALIYHTGYEATGEFLVQGDDCMARGRAVEDILFARLEEAGWSFTTRQVTRIGGGLVEPGDTTQSNRPRMVLRISVQHANRAAVEQFAREIPPLAAAGPVGVSLWSGGTTRPCVRPAFALWPTQVPKDALEVVVDVRTAQEWK